MCAMGHLKLWPRVATETHAEDMAGAFPNARINDPAGQFANDHRPVKETSFTLP